MGKAYKERLAIGVQKYPCLYTHILSPTRKQFRGFLEKPVKSSADGRLILISSNSFQLRI